MILTTHFLDEADVLADHVMIIAHGLVMCQGSAVELKNQFGGGYRVHLRNSSSGPELGFQTRKYLNETVYETPNSAAAASLISRLESMGHSDLFVNGPTIEDVFIKVAEELHDTQQGDPNELGGAKGGKLVSVTSKIPAEGDNLLSSGVDISFHRQVLVLFCKRVTILLRNWWPYLLALAMPIALTPNIRVFLDYYTIPSCLDLTADVHHAEQFNFQPAALDQNQEFTQMLVGPPSINETLYNVLSKFPVGQGIDIQNYTQLFIFEDNFPTFQNYISNDYTEVFPGGLYMDSNTTAPTYAYLGNSGTSPAKLMQNLWTQIRTGIPIVGYSAFFDSLISVRFTSRDLKRN